MAMLVQAIGNIYLQTTTRLANRNTYHAIFHQSHLTHSVHLQAQKRFRLCTSHARLGRYDDDEK